MSGRLRSIHFEDIVNKIRSRLEGWQARLLSSGAWLILLKQVL